MNKKQILLIAILSRMFITDAHASEPPCKLELHEKEPVVDAQHSPVAYIANFKNGKVLTGICDAQVDNLSNPH